MGRKAFLFYVSDQCIVILQNLKAKESIQPTANGNHREFRKLQILYEIYCWK